MVNIQVMDIASNVASILVVLITGASLGICFRYENRSVRWHDIGVQQGST